MNKSRLMKIRHRRFLSGTTLIEIMVCLFLLSLLLIFFGSLYTDTITIYKRMDFQSIGQKTAGVILEAISREVRGSVRIEGPNLGVITFPIDQTAHPLWRNPSTSRADSTTNPRSYVVFTNSASPVGQSNIFFHYAKNHARGSMAQPAIFYYTRGTRDPHSEAVLTHGYLSGVGGDTRALQKFSSDTRVVIENFEVWSEPDGAVIRIQVTDRAFTYDYNYITDTATPGAENKFFRRPIIEQSVFIATRYYQ